MNEWLSGFEFKSGKLSSILRQQNGLPLSADLAALRSRGAPTTTAARRTTLVLDLTKLQREGPARYLSAFDIKTQQNEELHGVFSFSCGRYTYLIPALVLLRGVFPLIPEAFEYAFTPRPLEALCFPLRRGNHWSVAMPDFTGAYRARYRRATSEALTWASVFPSGRKMWESVYLAAEAGRMDVRLPEARVSALVRGVRQDRVVHVTEFAVRALLALEEPFELAAGAPRSFVWNTAASPLAPNVNSYLLGREEGSDFSEVRLSDDEWTAVGPQLTTSGRVAGRGRNAAHSPRDVADGILIRAHAQMAWAQIPVPLSAAQMAFQAATWRRDGRFRLLLAFLRARRGELDYLDPRVMEERAAKHGRHPPRVQEELRA